MYVLVQKPMFYLACYALKDLAVSFSSHCLSSTSCLNEYLDIVSDRNM